jgi:hypothetical protein
VSMCGIVVVGVGGGGGVGAASIMHHSFDW